LINGIYKKNYPLNTQVTVEPTEFIKEHPKSGNLKKYISDMIITLRRKNTTDTFLMEAQISDNAEMVLRVFNYSVFSALDRRKISRDGSRMQIDMPSPVVIYWESSNTKDAVSVKIRFPDNKSIVYKVPTFKVLKHSVSELEGMALLLPFYVLKIRKELKKKGTDSAKRKALAKELENYMIEISEVFNECKRNNYINEEDATMLLRRMLSMHRELYGSRKEFVEVDMRIEKLVEVEVYKAVDKAEKKSQIKFAKAMKAGGEAMDKIMRYTGLSRRKIMAL
jgi:hypothetical protein